MLQTGKPHDNFEGWVVEFSSGQRFKFKTDHYIELHKLVDELTFENVLKAVRSRKIDYILQVVPDALLGDVPQWVEHIYETTERITEQTLDAFYSAPRHSEKALQMWAEQYHPELLPYLLAMYRKAYLPAVINELAFQDYTGLRAVQRTGELP